MAYDKKDMFSENVALPASATTEYSTNEVAFGAGVDAWGAAVATPNIGQGSPVYFCFVMTEVASTGSSPTLTLNLVGATTTAPTAIVQIITPAAVAAATLVAGYKFCVPLQIKPDMPRFLRLQVVAGTAGFTTGKYTAYLSPEPISG